MQAVITKSTRRGKKYMAALDGKTVHFGATGYQDFTTHGDKERKASYLERHKATEDWALRWILGEVDFME